MGTVVLKFGGTSVKDPERIKAVARKCLEYHNRGERVCVVVSAMAGETDRLLNLAKEITEEPQPRELDMLASTGEQVSIALLAMAIHSMEVPAISFTGTQVGFKTDAIHTKARIREINTERMEKALSEGKIVIVAGFQGITDELDITTLGRGGSDTSAVALAAVLKADMCYIYTDVDGVYTADPRIVPRAKRLDAISYDEMLELASAGAKVLHSRSVEFAKKFNVPLKVLSSYAEGKGTVVKEEVPEMEEILVSGINANDKEAKVTLRGVPDKPGMAAMLFNRLSNANIVVDMIVQSEGHGVNNNDISFTVEKGSLKETLAIANSIKDEIGATEVISESKIVKIAAVGVGMRSHAGVAAKMFNVLAEKGINIQMISTSEIKISCVIAEEYKELAVRALVEAFDLEEEE